MSVSNDDNGSWKTYTMQVERMRPRCGYGAARETELNDRVTRQSDDTAAWQKVLRVLLTAQNLQQHGDCWRLEGHVVDRERCAILHEVSVAASETRVVTYEAKYEIDRCYTDARALPAGLKKYELRE